MFVRLRDIRILFDESESILKSVCAKALGIKESDIERINIFRKSLDSRRGKPISYIYTVDVHVAGGVKFSCPGNADIIEKDEKYTIPVVKSKPNMRPVIVGFGPAGIFAALVLAKAGLCPIIFERGKCIDQRVKDVEKFFETGELLSDSNIQFGEGGAGTFSDGKLNTLVKDKNYRGRFVLEQLVLAGAPSEIMYINKPHVGTDKLRTSIQNIRKEIESLGASVFFEHTFVGFNVQNGAIHSVITENNGIKTETRTNCVMLGIGHSARDTFEMLKKSGIAMQRKPFAVGVRIEHKQDMINDVQYHGANNENLPAADYKLSYHTGTGRVVYSFCMCPGGYVVAAASEKDMVVTNGMSNFARDGENANAAILAEVKPDDFSGDDVLAGMYFQRDIERAAFLEGGGNYVAPAQLVGDFLRNKPSTKCAGIKPTYSRGVKYTDLRKVLPDFVSDAISEGILHFNNVIKGFADGDAIMTAVESRSSSPIRILRDAQTMQSDIYGLYPIGEGAGYAGGIMSAAMDGMKAAEAYIESLKRKEKQ